ncbi:TcpD family membrane protein, partial [Staphylococcus aureus]
GKYGHMVLLFVVGGFLFLVSKGPEQVFTAIAGVWKMIFGG